MILHNRSHVIMYPYTMQHYPFFILTAVIVNISPESPHNSGISGTIEFDQKSKDDPLLIKGNFSGLKPGLHGLHVHELKFDGVDCSSAGSHFNPKQVSFSLNKPIPDHIRDIDYRYMYREF